MMPISLPGMTSRVVRALTLDRHALQVVSLTTVLQENTALSMEQALYSNAPTELLKKMMGKPHVTPALKGGSARLSQ